MRSKINIILTLGLTLLFSLKFYLCINPTKLSEFEEISLSLSGTNHYAAYYYSTKNFPMTIKKSEVDLYLQIRKNYKTQSTLYIYYYNGKQNCEETIQYDETKGTFSGYSQLFQTSLNQDYEEFNFGQEKTCHILVFYIPKDSEQNYDGNFIVFSTPVSVVLNELSMDKYYFIFNNNYNSNNYYFYINTEKLDLSQNIDVICQMKSATTDQIFEFYVYRGLNINMQLEKLYEESISNNLNFNIKLDQELIYLIQIESKHEEKSTESSKFAIFFEFKKNYNKTSSLLNGAEVCNNLISDSVFYYYYNINDMELNESKYFILNFRTDNLNELKLEYSISNEKIDFYNVSNDYLDQLASQNNYTNLKSKTGAEGNLIYYKFTKDSFSFLANIIFIKISANTNNVNDFSINQICTKNLQKEVLNTTTYKKFFNSPSILNKTGYYYLPKQLVLNDTILYCSKIDTVTIYEGEYDIISGNSPGYLINDKIFPVPNIYNNTSNGYTIIISNIGDDSFLFQLDTLDPKIKNSLLQFTFDSLYSHNNKEIKVDENTNELFVLSSFKNKEKDDYFILDPKIIYGNLSILYLNVDNIENDENFDIKYLFSTKVKKKYNLNNLKNPLLLNNSNEFIIIINNNYKIAEKSSFGLLYLNRYQNNEKTFSLGELTPIMLNNSNKQLYYFINFPNRKLYYQFLLGAKYNKNIFIEIKIGNKNLNLTNQNFKAQGEDLVLSSNSGYINFKNGDNSNSYLIWARIELNENLNEEISNIIKVPLSSKYFDGIAKTNKKYLFVFDWDKIKQKNSTLILPYKIKCSMMNQTPNKNYGYYYQVLVNDSTNYDYILDYGINNSIYYEYGLNTGLYFIDGKINITEYNNFFNEKKIFNTIISFNSQISSIKLSFYIDYLSKNQLLLDSLNYMDFDDTIYYLNSPLSAPSYGNKYLHFQILFCEYQSNFSFYIKKDNEEIEIKDRFEKETNNNYFGMIDLTNYIISEDESLNIYLRTFLPKKMFFNYFYTNINQSSQYYVMDTKDALFDDGDDYNINIENLQGELVVSFDRFASYKKVKYILLIGKKTELKIDNECQFLQFLLLLKQEQLKNVLYFDAENDGFNNRVKIQIELMNYGNYIVYVLAHSLDIDSQYKLLGYKTYSYNIDENDQNQNQVNSSVFILLIIIIILVIFIIGFLVYHCYQRVNNFNILKLSSFNSSLLTQSFKSTDNDTESNKCIQLIDKPINKEKVKKINEDNINVNESLFNIIKNESSETNTGNNGEINNEDNNQKNQIDQNVENRTSDLDFLSPPIPAFLFQRTENPDEDIFDNAFDSRNNINRSNEEDFKKNYINNIETTKGL